MKKTRFEKFMAATTATAMDLVELETFEDHLVYTKLMIDVELLKVGKKEKPTMKGANNKRAGAQSRVDQISGALGTTKRTAIRIGIALTKTYDFLATGNNLVIVVIGSLFLYAALVMALEMI